MWREGGAAGRPGDAGQRPGGTDETHQRKGCRGGAGQGRQQVARRGVRAGGRGNNADQREHAQADHPVPEPAHGQDADARGKERQHHEDAAHQDELVV